ncbi:MAG: glycine cleavage system protein GcvH [Clostridiales bacterium]|jgi:glycine cleavage system H protein|nr:glycine cleavage system protein GcvH [Clostridiales bacterium]
MTPDDRKYTKDHEWVLLDGQHAELGITDHAQRELGDIVFVELPAVGDRFAAGDRFAVVESVKAVSNVYTPIAGEITAVNNALENEPELLNGAPYEQFLVQLRVEAINGIELLDAAGYDAHITESQVVPRA